MMCLSKCLCATVAIVVLAGPAAAADAIANGKIKSLNADKKTFVLLGADNKDYTFHFGDKLTINRGGKDAPNSLKENDMVSISYDKGVVDWTANYILVQDGDTKYCNLMRVTFKNYDAAKKEIVVTDNFADNKVWTFPMGAMTVRLDGRDSKIDDIKIGSPALAIVHQEPTMDRPALKSLLAWTK